MSKLGRVMLVLVAPLILSGGAWAQSAVQAKYFSNWPAGVSPREIGSRVGERFVGSPHSNATYIAYEEVCTWYGALIFAQVSGDKALTAELMQRFEPLMSAPGSALIPNKRHVDFSMFGSLPLEI